jgi:hypothetical protein
MEHFLIVALVLFQGGDLVLHLADRIERRKRAQAAAEPANAPGAAKTPVAPADHVAILKRAAGTFHLIGHRPHGHADIHEALATPGLAVQHPDGRIEEGVQ